MTNARTPYGIAISFYPDPTLPPILTAGEITPEALLTFEQDCQAYFTNANGRVAKDKMVSHILGSFRNQHVRNWITINRNTLTALDFETFMKHLRSEVLPPNWEFNVLTRIFDSNMPRNERFIVWARHLQAENYLLRGGQSHLTDECLRDRLEANIDADLRLLAAQAGAATKTSLRDWLNSVEQLDAKRKRDLKPQRKIVSNLINKGRAS